jgi:ParB/RepB/Spo0J family partition protein
MALKLIGAATQVPLSEIMESEQKVRETTSDIKLDDLMKSMINHGQIHAVSLLQNKDGTKELINGHRRFGAAKRGDFATLRANIYEVPEGQEDDKDLLISQHLYAANMSEQLVPLERARFFEALMVDMDFTVEQVAQALEGETVESVVETMRILQIDEEVLEVIQAHPEKFTPTHLQVLADYASAATKGAWRIKPDEQMKIVREIADQTNKQVARDPRKLELHIKSMVNDRRNKEKQRNSETRRALTDPVKTVFKALDGLDTAVRNLQNVDLSTITDIDAGDKGAALKRVYDAIEQLTVFNEDRLAKLRVRKAAGQASWPAPKLASSAS